LERGVHCVLRGLIVWEGYSHNNQWHAPVSLENIVHKGRVQGTVSMPLKAPMFLKRGEGGLWGVPVHLEGFVWKEGVKRCVAPVQRGTTALVAPLPHCPVLSRMSPQETTAEREQTAVHLGMLPVRWGTTVKGALHQPNHVITSPWVPSAQWVPV